MPAVAKLPDGPEWVYEIKLGGYRTLAINSNGKLRLYSRKRKSFNRQYPHIVEALNDLPQDTDPRTNRGDKQITFG
jgi:bifunctional non-homologous end joining protein LigD